MQSSASALRGRSTVEASSDAPSSTAPDAVTQECCQCGERKNTSAGREVWVSVMSTNQPSHSRQSPSSRRQPPMIEDRMRMAVADGGVLARTSRAATAASRRWNDWYIEGR
jgi:hypothetical protein